METLAEPVETADEAAAAPPFRPQVVVALAVLSVVRGELAALLHPAAAPGGAPATGTERRGGLWMLPRRVPRAHQTLDEAARGEVARCTGERTTYLEQLYAWTDPPANERECVLEVAYLSLHPNAGASEPARPGRAEAAWWTLSQLPRLLPGHDRILEDARQRLSWKLGHTNVAWSLLPAEFSLSDLQLVYEVIQDGPLDKRNFRKWVLGNGLVEATAHERREGAHRPARLYRFTSRQLRVLE